MDDHLLPWAQLVQPRPDDGVGQAGPPAQRQLELGLPAHVESLLLQQPVQQLAQPVGLAKPQAVEVAV